MWHCSPRCGGWKSCYKRGTPGAPKKQQVRQNNPTSEGSEERDCTPMLTGAFNEMSLSTVRESYNRSLREQGPYPFTVSSERKGLVRVLEEPPLVSLPSFFPGLLQNLLCPRRFGLPWGAASGKAWRRPLLPWAWYQHLFFCRVSQSVGEHLVGPICVSVAVEKVLAFDSGTCDTSLWAGHERMYLKDHPSLRAMLPVCPVLVALILIQTMLTHCSLSHPDADPELSVSG